MEIEFIEKLQKLYPNNKDISIITENSSEDIKNSFKIFFKEDSHYFVNHKIFKKDKIYFPNVSLNISEIYEYSPYQNTIYNDLLNIYKSYDKNDIFWKKSNFPLPELIMACNIL